MIKSEVNFSKLTTIIKQEALKWKNGNLNEKVPEAYPMLKNYWDNLGLNMSEEQMSDTATQNKWPWSAAYISYVMTRVDSTFPKSSAHREYFLKAKENRNKNGSLSYKAYSLSREREPILSQIGDILGKPRSGSYTDTHSDVVYEVIGNVAKLAGGNLENTNKVDIRINLNTDGSYPKNPNNYIVVIKKR